MQLCFVDKRSWKKLVSLLRFLARTGYRGLATSESQIGSLLNGCALCKSGSCHCIWSNLIPNYSKPPNLDVQRPCFFAPNTEEQSDYWSVIKGETQTGVCTMQMDESNSVMSYSLNNTNLCGNYDGECGTNFSWVLI